MGKLVSTRVEKFVWCISKQQVSIIITNKNFENVIKKISTNSSNAQHKVTMNLVK